MSDDGEDINGLNSKQRIDMGHGFMKSVIRNQIDRDNYDKEVKAKQTSGKSHGHGRPRRERKPEIQTYRIPPQRMKQDDSDALFYLEYQHKNGDVMKINVTHTDHPMQVARRVGARYDLTEDFVLALAQRLQQEVDARLA